jgi:two-component system cell cycle sensor histidine kinase/response regulator CckA
VQDFDPANFVILVVDDDVAVRALIANVLRKEGYQVLNASNGEHALEILKAHAGPVHLLLTDFVMPGMNGIELAAAVRNKRQGITVLVISGYTSSQIVAEEEKFDFLQKPMAPHKLLEKVRELLFRPPVLQHSDDK